MSQSTFSLIVRLPGEEPVRHDLEGDIVTFGRSPENQIQVLVSEVSVKHGRFVREGETYRVIDPGSTNGTRVNETPVGAEGTLLKPMDRLVLGTVVPAYFVPTQVLASTPLAELVASLESARQPAEPKTAAVAVSSPAAAAPVRSAIPAGSPPAAPASPGGTTVRLDQVRSPGVRPASAPTAPRLPIPGSPAAPAKPTVGMPQKPGVAPLKPPAPAASRPAAAPPAGGAPGVPQPVPLKRPAPSSPTIPLPKKPGQ